MIKAVALNAAASGAGVALLGTSAWLLSRAAEHPPVLFLMVAIVGVRFFGLSRGVLRYLERLVGHRVALTAQAELRTRVYAALARGTWIGRRSGDLLSRVVNDVAAVQDRIVRAVVPLAGGAVVLAGGGLALTVIAPVTGALLVLVLLVGGGLLPWLAGRIAARAERSVAPLRGELATVLAEAADAAPDLVAFGAAGPLATRVDAADAALRRAEQRAASVTALTHALQLLSTGAAVLIGLVTGAYAVAAGTVAPVQLAVLTLTPLALHEVLVTLPPAVQAWHRSAAALRRVDTLVEAQPQTMVHRDPAGLDALGSVRLEELAVGWPGQPDAVRGLDLEVRSGERVALVGPSGSGKTTVAATVMGLLTPRSGRVEVTGSVGYLDQDAHLFDTTVAENLRIGDRSADDEALRSVLRRVGLSLALDRLVGEHGSRLSGGEARRIALARLLLRDHAVLVVDEPTEHLDRPTADALVDDLWRVSEDVAVLVITHDPVLMARCDRVVTLADQAD